MSAQPERRFYRNRITGELGYMVEKYGKEMIRLNRPAEELLSPYSSDTWIPEKDDRVFTKMQVMRIAFEADRALCRILGIYDQAKTEWQGLKDDERMKFQDVGPTDSKGKPATDKRAALFKAIVSVFPGAK